MERETLPFDEEEAKSCCRRVGDRRYCSLIFGKDNGSQSLVRNVPKLEWPLHQINFQPLPDSAHISCHCLLCCSYTLSSLFLCLPQSFGTSAQKCPSFRSSQGGFPLIIEVSAHLSLPLGDLSRLTHAPIHVVYSTRVFASSPSNRAPLPREPHESRDLACLVHYVSPVPTLGSTTEWSFSVSFC